MAHNFKQILGEAKEYLTKPKKAKTLERFGRIWKSFNQALANSDTQRRRSAGQA